MEKKGKAVRFVKVVEKKNNLGCAAQMRETRGGVKGKSAFYRLRCLNYLNRRVQPSQHQSLVAANIRTLKPNPLPWYSSSEDGGQYLINLSSSKCIPIIITTMAFSASHLRFKPHTDPLARSNYPHRMEYL